MARHGIGKAWHGQGMARLACGLRLARFCGELARGGLGVKAESVVDSTRRRHWRGMRNEEDLWYVFGVRG